MKDWEIRSVDELAARRAASGRPYLEFLRVQAMSAGVYELPAGGTDPQGPHREDEIYHVVAGRARFRAGEEVTDVAPGAVIYVRAGVEHRFEEIDEHLRLLVVFSPCESP